MIYDLIVGAGVGLLFGVVLEKSKVMEASMIIGQFLFKRFIMLKVFITAMIVSIIVLNLMNYAGLFSFQLKNFNLFSNILGGGLLGAGIAFSGACPGTIFAQVAVGYKDAFFTIAGGLCAAYAYLFFGDDIVKCLSPWTLGKFQLSDFLGVSVSFLSLGIVFVLGTFLGLIEKKYPWKSDME